jgi:tetratricopeptide (TPR) repeat protein
MFARPRHGPRPLDTNPSRPDRHLQRGVRSHLGGSRERRHHHPGVRAARERRQGRNPTKRTRGRAFARRHGSYWPATDPNVGLAHNLKGVLLRGQGKIEEAIAEYREAIRLHPALAIAHTNLGFALLLENKPQEALAESQRGVELAPQSPDAHSGKCYLLGTEKPEEAKAECETAIPFFAGL